MDEEAGTIKIELVVWIDSSSRFGWLDTEDSKVAIWKCQSIGFLIDETDEGIALAESRSEPKAGHKPYADVISIPKVAILKRITLSTVKASEIEGGEK